MVNEDARGNCVAKVVWEWLQAQKTIHYVPWVLDPGSKSYDPVRVAREEERTAILNSLSRCIKDEITRLDIEA